MLDLMLARVEELVQQSLIIAGPQEQEAWVRAQVAEDARPYANAAGTPNFREPAVQMLLDKIYPKAEEAIADELAFRIFRSRRETC